MKEVNWGIIGSGNIAHSFAQGLSLISEANLEAAASKSGKAQKFINIHNGKSAYGGESAYKDLVNDPNVEIIYVATTHNFHYENILLCLEHGKPVLSEKPFTINAKQAEKIIKIARKKDLFVMEGMWSRFLPCMVRLRELLDNEKENIIGEVKHVKADFGFTMPFDPEHRAFNPNLAGGALLDLGIYCISLASMIFKQPPEKIKSSAYLGETGVDEQSYYLFEYKDGQTAMLSSSNRVLMPHRAIIAGTKGFIEIPNFSRPNKLEIWIQGRKMQTEKVPFEPKGFQYETIEVMKCLEAGKIESEIMPLDETLEIMKTMDSLRAQWDFKYPEEI
ncbi:MAG: Gfo/Idh/MocA family protein [Promethearchaeota archaeon]